MGKRKAPSEDSSSNKNKEICEMLMELADYEKNVTRQIHKHNAYRKAAASIMKHPQAITNGKEAAALPGIGKKISEKIDEFLTQGKLQKLEKIRADDTSVAMKQLVRVSGIGPAHAKKLVDDGITSIEDLRKHTDKLNHHQQIGLKYMEEFEERIPRAEMELLEAEAKKIIESVDNTVIATVCGSYRRGAKSSGDIDILITHPQFTTSDKSAKDILTKVVTAFDESGFLTDKLSHGDTKFMGVCLLKSEEGEPARIHHRIDVRLIPHDEYFCGLLYFTGSDEFNRQMRATALDKGYTLNEYCIRKLSSDKATPGEKLPVTSERDVFDYIGMEYKEPNERSL
uniref:DNA polymerase n=1 Tax=Plectus sambesii TaxID=2011161 RepID=A0A914VLV9_9BILA